MSKSQLDSNEMGILDCTIRDGSYVVGYQFTIEDTSLVAYGLSAAGIRHIEVGHGMGLNAQNVGKGNAAITDTDYIHAARSAITGNSIVGSFFIPGIGNEDSMRAAADAGLGFIRLGIDVDDFRKLEPFTKLAKSLGLEVWGNMMKSYVVSPAGFGEAARCLADTGVDVIALVDSAGGMTPDDVYAYTEAALQRAQVRLGFHGHNNLGLANANCLRFLDAGGLYVDGTLAGLGRSGGNAATEVLAALLTMRGDLPQPLDWPRLLEFADAVTSFCVPFHARPRAAEIATGLNFFHSSFSTVVDKAAEHAGASLFRTILNLPQESRKQVTLEIAQAAAEAAARTHPSSPLMGTGVEFVDRQQPASLKQLAARLSVQKGKSPQKIVISIAHAPDISIYRIRPLRGNHDALVAHIEVAGEHVLSQVFDEIGQAVDLWMVDQNLGLSRMPAAALPLYTYDDDALIAQAVADALQSVSARRVRLQTGIVAREKILQRLPRGMNIVDNEADALIVGCVDDDRYSDLINTVTAGGAVFLLGAGSLPADAIERASKLDMQLRRLDYGPALVAEAARLLGTQQLHDRARDLEIEPGVRVVAGGIVGRHGDIVVDSLDTPRFILGAADGCGGLAPVSMASASAIAAVQSWIVKSWNL